MTHNISLWWEAELNVVKNNLPSILLYKDIEDMLTQLRRNIKDHLGCDVLTIPSDPHFHSVHTYAAYAHGTQKRKYTGQPYIEHPLKTSLWYHHLYDDIQGAYLMLCHDIIEDCDPQRYRIEDLRDGLGDAFIDLMTLTDVPGVSRKERKKLSYEKLQNGTLRSRRGKLIDSLDNLVGIALTDPVFGCTYCSEKKELFNVLQLSDDDVVIKNIVLESVESILNYYKNTGIHPQHPHDYNFFRRTAYSGIITTPSQS